MGLEKILDIPVEDAASLIKQFIEHRRSRELDLDSYRTFPSTVIAVKARKNEPLISKLTNVCEHLMKHYEHITDFYLNELIIMSSMLRVAYTPKFLEDVKKSDYYPKIDEQTKGMIERGILTFKEGE